MDGVLSLPSCTGKKRQTTLELPNTEHKAAQPAHLDHKAKLYKAFIQLGELSFDKDSKAEDIRTALGTIFQSGEFTPSRVNEFLFKPMEHSCAVIDGKGNLLEDQDAFDPSIHKFAIYANGKHYNNKLGHALKMLALEGLMSGWKCEEVVLHLQPCLVFSLNVN